MSGGHLIPKPDSRGLVGNIISVVGQVMRDERHGSGWDNVQQHTLSSNQQQYRNQKYYNQYSCDYRGMSRRGGRGDFHIKPGFVSIPVDVYKKFLGIFST